MPSWLIQLGSLAGLGALIFTIFDRFLAGRPMVSIRPVGYNMRNCVFFNPSNHDILIRKISVHPKWVGLAKSDSILDIVKFAVGDDFAIFLHPQRHCDFPLIFKKGELLERDCTALAPFVIFVSWRRAQSSWLPQIPIVIFSSAKSMRRLNDIKRGNPITEND